jgi:ATP-dependent helicase/nuclease subunit B
VQIEYLLGPAGSGKTFRCLAEIRAALQAAPEGPPLLLLAPKQTTYQLERQLLADPAIDGFTRLRILSFERLAHWILENINAPLPALISEEGRVMVLRGLLAKKRMQLKLFRASARLTGFAQQLSLLLSELQRHGLTPDKLNRMAEQLQRPPGLSLKLEDLASLLQQYLDWLDKHQLQDADTLLDSVAKTLAPPAKFPLRIDHLWVDGFAEWSPQELDLLSAFLPACTNATFTFCLEDVPVENISWLSTWSVARRAFLESKKRFRELPHATNVLLLPRNQQHGRFAHSPILQHLEQFWAQPQPFQGGPISFSPPTPPQPLGDPEKPVQLEWLWPGASATAESSKGRARKRAPVKQVSVLKVETSAPPVPPSIAPLAGDGIESALRIVHCADIEAELTLAAREILQHVRQGGRYREITVLLRQLSGYHEPLQRVFSRFEIPFFVDRRESVSHHPLAELTRSALRTVALQWKHEDWFAALKSGLVPVNDREVDRLENEALARGWKGTDWHQPLQLKEEPRSPQEGELLRSLEQRLERLRQHTVPPFERLALAMAVCNQKPNGQELAAAVRELWKELAVEQTLEHWAATELAEPSAGASVHRTVWEQLNQWLANVELAFPNEALPVREWLPILEAGLGSLTVGVVPPVLDQVLVGSVDRLRNPDVKLALLLGLNEGVFPATPQPPLLLTETDRIELEKHEPGWSATTRHQLSRERYLAYIACTRARERLVLICAARDGDGAPLHPSPFLTQVQRLFPSLKPETFSGLHDWRQSEHPIELLAHLLKAGKLESFKNPAATEAAPWQQVARLPAIARLVERVSHFQDVRTSESLSPQLAEELYGSVLHTSVSRIEQFAACPFQFFVHSGLRAEERKLFELDAREQGSFQHDVLAFFHNELRREGKRWRDLTPEQARERVGKIAAGLVVSYRQGLLQSSSQSRFTARVLTEALQDFVEILVRWMHEQYGFDPVEVELPFGRNENWPPWELDLNQGHRLALQGRIDRVDLCKLNGSDEAWCVVVDYKSSQKKLEPILIANGLQLQLLGYLNVLRHSTQAPLALGVSKLSPAGVFYVSLRGRYPRAANRLEALADLDRARKLAYRHSGRFDLRALRQLDLRQDVTQGDQFNFRLTTRGVIHRNCTDPLDPAAFEALMDSVERNLKQMGSKIFAGVVDVAPYRRGSVTPCEHCEYASICRIDPWTHPFRTLKKDPAT